MVVLVNALPIELLEAWLQSEPQVRTASQESVVVDRVYAEYLKKPAGIPNWLKKKLGIYRNIPGSARATFVYYWELSDSELKDLIPRVLKDLTVEDTEVTAILLKHKKFILDNIDIKTLQLDAARMELMRRTYHLSR
jgi:hypothetical protein